MNLAFSGLQGKYISSHISRQKWSILPRWRTTVLTIVSDVNISIHPVTRVTGLYIVVQKYSFWCFLCKNNFFYVFHAKMIIQILFVQKYISLHYLFRFGNSKVLRFEHVYLLGIKWVSIMQEKWKLTEIWQKETFMRSCAKISTRNGSKRHLKAVMQKYSQEIAGKHCFREVVLKYSCPTNPKGQDPQEKILPLVVRKYSF